MTCPAFLYSSPDPLTQLDLVSAPASPSAAEEDASVDEAPSTDNSAAIAEQESLREVPKEEAKAYAEEAGLLFFETSAKTGEMVSEVFTEIGQSGLKSFRADLSSQSGFPTDRRDGLAPRRYCVLTTIQIRLLSFPAKKIPLDNLAPNAAAAARAGGAPAAGAAAAGRGERVTLGDEGTKAKDGCAC